MKPLTLTLLGTTAVFAGTSVYLALELGDARDALVESGRRELPAERRADDMPSPGPGDMDEPPSEPADAPPGPAPASPPVGPPSPGIAEPPMPGAGRNRLDKLTPAEQRQRRIGQETRLRERLGDMPREIGIDTATADRLYDLLTDSQIAMQTTTREYAGDPAGAKAVADSMRQERDAAINALLGPDKAADFLSYEKSIPARMQVGRIDADMTASDIPLREDQRKEMIVAIAEIQEKYPQPSRQGGRESQTEFLDWQAEYSKRVQARIEPLLTSEQRARYREAVEIQNSRRAATRARFGQRPTTGDGQ